MLLTACLMTGFIGCSDDDPNYDNVTPPAVVVAPNTLTGVITDNQGNPLSDAKVSLDATQVSTDAEGVFFFSDVNSSFVALGLPHSVSSTFSPASTCSFILPSPSRSA